jgi:hypothetical protein
MPSHYWIRAFYTAITSDAAVGDLISFARRAKAQGIVLLTQSFDTEPGLLLPDDVQKRTAHMKQVVPSLRKAGFDVQINVMSTLGHGLNTGNTVEKLGFQPMVDHLGNESAGTPCPLDPAFREYSASLYAHMAQVGPSVLWIDDDVRYAGHGTPGTGCFCPLHMERVSDRLGLPARRDSILAEILVEEPVPTPERLAWHTVNFEAMTELFDTIREAVHEVDAGIELGLMTVGHLGHAAEGRDTPELLDAMAPGRIRWFRPGAGHWTDERPLGAVTKSEDAFRQIVLAGENVRAASEVENYPYSRALKSLGNLHLEMTLNALAGMSDQTLNLFDALHGVRPEDREIADLLNNSKPRLDTIADAIADKTRIGIGVAANEQIGSLIPPAGTQFYATGAPSWSETLARLGLPLWTTGCHTLHHLGPHGGYDRTGEACGISARRGRIRWGGSGADRRSWRGTLDRFEVTSRSGRLRI